MGHNVHYGRFEEITFAGVQMIQIDAFDWSGKTTRHWISTNSLFDIRIMDEASCRAAVGIPPAAMLPAPNDAAFAADLADFDDAEPSQYFESSGLDDDGPSQYCESSGESTDGTCETLSEFAYLSPGSDNEGSAKRHPNAGEDRPAVEQPGVVGGDSGSGIPQPEVQPPVRDVADDFPF